MGHAIYFFLYLLDFVIIQVFFIFKCLSVPSSRKKCLAITIIYTVVFYAADYITYGPDPGHMTMEMYIINSVFHAINTFIYFAIILVFAEGYMPRNVIKLFFYYDVLSLATSKFTFGFLPTLFISDDMNVSPSVYAAHTIDDMWLIIPYYLFICIFIIAYLLFNNLLTKLLEKIPDSVCLVVFVICIISFLITRIVSAFLYEDLYGNNAYKSGSFFFGCMILITFLVIMLFFIISNSKRKQEYQEIRTLEKTYNTIIIVMYFKSILVFTNYVMISQIILLPLDTCPIARIKTIAGTMTKCSMLMLCIIFVQILKNKSPNKPVGRFLILI